LSVPYVRETGTIPTLSPALSLRRVEIPSQEPGRARSEARYIAPFGGVQRAMR